MSAPNELDVVPLDPFPTVSERLDRLDSSIRQSLELAGDDIILSRDALDWIEFLAVPCQVPVAFRQISSCLQVEIGPTDDQKPAWLSVQVSFDEEGKWAQTTISNETLGRTLSAIPQPSWGLEASTAAALLGLQIFSADHSRRPSWTAWGLGSQGTSTLNVALEQQRTQTLQRLRNLLISKQVRNRALESVARGHEQDFYSALKSETIMTALSSDWHPH